MKLKTLILATALLGLTAIIPAAANTSCSWVGDFWVCNGGGGSSSCSWVGDFWVCN